MPRTPARSLVPSVLVPLLVVGAVALAGCGTSNADYEKQIADLQSQLDSSQAELESTQQQLDAANADLESTQA